MRDRDELIARRPAQVGNLDGIPLADRDRANRVVLDRHLAAGPDSHPADRYQTLATLQQAATVHLVDGEPVQMRRYLHTFRPDDDKVAVAIGPHDLDRHDGHAAILIPGTKVRFDRFATQIGRAERLDLQLRSDDADYAAGGLTMVWLGYRNPKNLAAALLPTYANRGGARLAGTVAGLRATLRDADIGLIGHSYGSKVALRATTHHDAAPDTITLVAPPGGGRQLDVAADRLGRDIDVMWYGNDFLNRDAPVGRRAPTAILRLAHGAALRDGTPNVRTWERPAAPDVIDGYDGGPHSAYFYDDDAIAAIARSALGRQTLDMQPADQQALR